ncbi:MAG TPA: diguanylate cyclase [Thermoanaerobaculia bacterium]|nr:diguanylate cyclase [Thermoanaerobaculia bacterium]
MAFFQSLEGPAVFLLGVLVVTAVGAVDFATGIELRIYPLYFIPVSFVSWRVGKRAGIAFAFLSAAVWQVSNFLAGMDRAGTFVAVWNTGMQLLAFLVVAILIAELQGRLEREKDLSRTDSLTGLANGTAFRERATLEVARTRRWRRPLTLACVDLDSFRAINEEFGQALGNEVLRTVAVSPRSAIRSTDLAARIEGDKFTLLFPKTDKAGAKAVLETVLGRLHQDLIRAGWPVTASIGSVTTIEATSPESLLRQAEQVMYEVKKTGKAAVRAAEAGDANPVA